MPWLFVKVFNGHAGFYFYRGVRKGFLPEKGKRNDHDLFDSPL